MKNESIQGKRSSGTMLVEVMVGLVLSSMLLALTGSLWQAASRDFAAISDYAEQAKTSHRRNIRLASQPANLQNSGFNTTKSAVVEMHIGSVSGATPCAVVSQKVGQSGKAE